MGAESTAAIDRLAEAAGEFAGLLGIVVEVDCGAERSGVPPEEAGRLAAYARDRGLVPLGVFHIPWARRRRREVRGRSRGPRLSRCGAL